VLQDCYRDYQLATAYCSQLRARTQLIAQSLKEFATIIEQLIHQALLVLPQYYIQREAAYAFVKGIKDGKVKQQLSQVAR
jgi:lysophospholipid acyltransferase (LPLAT)-like uncharacterized protein